MSSARKFGVGAPAMYVGGKRLLEWAGGKRGLSAKSSQEVGHREE